MSSDHFEIHEDRIAYKGFIRLRQLQLRHRMFAGGWSAPVDREIAYNGTAVAVAVLPFDPNRQEVVLVEQFRTAAIDGGLSPWLIEPVAGLMERGESASDVAFRELREESGLEAQDLEPCGSGYASPGCFAEFVHFFIARVGTETAGGLHGLDHEQEDIRTHVVSVERAADWLASGKISSLPGIVLLQALLLRRADLTERWSGTA
ncbi:MAG: NUDIX domain-containing protein [Geminicoccaceae bacterium]